MIDNISVDLFRPDIYSLIDGQINWDDVLFQEGFVLRQGYKEKLILHGFVSSSDVSKYNAITIEARKEVTSERMFWENLPKVFPIHQLNLPYRSPLLLDARSKAAMIINGNPDLSEADKRGVVYSCIFPYRQLVFDMCKNSPELEREIRMELISDSDNEVAIAAARNLGIDPLDKLVSPKEVKRIIVEYCFSRNLAVVAPRKFRKNGLIVGRSLGNGLILILMLWEVRSKSSHGFLNYNMDLGIDLVTEEFFVADKLPPFGSVWRHIEIESEFSPYGLKFTSSSSFYVGLAYRLRCFELLCHECDRFFGLTKAKSESAEHLH
jgi:hypothetical protein